MFVKPALNVRRSIVQPENLRPERRRPARTRGRKEARWATPILAINCIEINITSIAINITIIRINITILAINRIGINVTSIAINITSIEINITIIWINITILAINFIEINITPASQSAHGDQKLKPTKENAARNRRPERKMEARLTKTIKNNHDDEETDDHKDVNDC